MNKLIFFPPNRVWRSYNGGKLLDILERKTSPSDSHYPEDWIASTTEAINPGDQFKANEGISRLPDGILFNKMLKDHPIEMLGENHFKQYGANTQVLVKFLDAANRLQFQCHPTKAFSQKHLNSNNGKTEAYYILDVRGNTEEPYIYLGFQNPPSKEKWKQIIESQDKEAMKACFEKIPVKKGDVFYVPGGLPHAIGEGIFMVEVLEPTDFVARIEFEKDGYTLPLEARFMNRDIDFALEMFNYEKYSIARIQDEFYSSKKLIKKIDAATEQLLIGSKQTDCFSVSKLTIEKEYIDNENSFYIALVVGGKGNISANRMKYDLKFGDKFFVPFSTKDVTYTANSNLEIIKIFPPGYSID